jgi:hypothetical protein
MLIRSVFNILKFFEVLRTSGRESIFEALFRMNVTLDEISAEIAALGANLPTEVDALGTSTKYKTAMKVHMLRESLIWREEELARSALILLNNDDFVAAALVTRGVMETTAAIVYLHGLVDRALKQGMDDALDAKLNGFLTGSKIWHELPGAINVLTMIDKVEKLIPGYRGHYNFLSEYSHPNWSGTHGAYGIINHDTAIVSFAKGGRSAARNRQTVSGMLAGSVSLFAGYYNLIGDLIAPFADLVEQFYDAQQNTSRTA